ncbi:MAG: GNAT family protein [Pseudolysinimonas sp.]
MRLDLGELSVAPLAASDLPAFAAYRSDPGVARYQSWSANYTLDDARRLLDDQAGWDFPPAGDWMQFGVTAAGTLVGDVAVHPLLDRPDCYEFGVTFAPAAQGRGLATRAVAGVVDYLFRQRGAHRVFAQCDARNAAVKRLLERNGFRHEGAAVEADWFKGEWTTLETWAILARECAA